MESLHYWFITIDNDVENEIFICNVAYKIECILDDKKGWKKLGYNFKQIQPIKGLELRKNKENWRNVFHVRFSSPETIKKTCNISDLSCADMGKNIIYFNKDRWLHGSKESNLSLDDYRNYVVLHEFGHLLNRLHQKCTLNKNDKCSIMYQQTKSTGCCTPNPWILDSD